ncbi:ion transporter [Fulvivirga sp.]|uniref:ion transporter n=1 Tax=Fulvivirga sp. TaxID=1931237 RepID=UPI0032F04F9E
MKALRKIIIESDSRQGRIFDIFIQVLIVISLITFSVDTLPNKTESTTRLLRTIEIITVSIFTIEYLFRVVLSERKLKFVFSFFGLVDLLSILPFYLSVGLDLRSLRALRLLRLFKLFRYSKTIRRMKVALSIARQELVLFFSLTCILLYLSAVGIYYFENAAQPESFSSIFSSLWWAVATLTTVGYGDIYPITVGGKIFTFAILMVGLGIVAIPAGIIASAVEKARDMEG